MVPSPAIKNENFNIQEPIEYKQPEILFLKLNEIYFLEEQTGG